MDNPAAWNIPVAPGNGNIAATIDLTGGNLLYWIAVDASGNQLAFQDLDSAVAVDINRSPFPAAVGFQPWPFPGNPGWPAGFNGFEQPTWPTPAPPPVPPAAIPVIGAVPPTTGEGAGLLFPRRPY